jgi:hypothetical protein
LQKKSGLGEKAFEKNLNVEYWVLRIALQVRKWLPSGTPEGRLSTLKN